MDRTTAIRELIAGMLGISPERVTAETAQADLPEWDSVNHLNLMLGIEDSFGVRLTVDDMARMRSVPAIVEFLERECPST